MQRTVTLWNPVLDAALRALDATSQPRAPELETLLSRATRSPAHARSSVAAAFELFGERTSADTHAPVAPVTYAVDAGVDMDHYVLRADPVYVVPDGAVLRMLAHAELDIGTAEAGDIARSLNEHFSPDGLRFETPQSHRWYVLTPRDPQVRLHPLADALGQSLDPLLPEGADATYWHGVMNEIQMLLHAHPVNIAREAHGALPINSLWLWGGGRTPKVSTAPWAQVWSDDALILGLAKLTRVPRGGAPANAREWLDAAITPGDHLVTPKSNAATDPREVIEAFNRDWIAPLTQALKARQITSIALVLESGARFTAQGKMLERWWVRRRPLTAWAQGIRSS